MTSNRPSGRPSSGGVPPTSRRSARQQRLANREANRALARASTRGSGGSNGSIVMYTIVAVAVAVVVIGGAFLLTNQPKPKSVLNSPNPPNPSFATPSNIPVDGLTLGNPNAPHTINIWEDFQCPNCEAFTRDDETQLVANYVATGKAKLVWHDFLVIDSNTGGTESLDAANAARCAADQNMFWPYHDWLYANQYSEGSGAYTKDRLKAIGQLMGIPDLNTFDSCVDNGTHDKDIQNEQTQIPSSFSGTPTITIDNDSPVAGYSYAAVSAALNTALGISPSPSVSPSPSATPTASAPASEGPSSEPSTSPSALPS